MRFAKESIPSQSLSILNGVLNPPERRINSESCLRRPPDGQQHTEVEPDHILLHLQSMTRGSGWNIFSNYNKVMTKGRKTVNDEFLLPTNASWWSSPESSEQADALKRTAVTKRLLWPIGVFKSHLKCLKAHFSLLRAAPTLV